MTPFLIFIFVIIVVGALIEQAKKVKQELVNEAMEERDWEQADIIENMSEEEIIENYEDRF